MEYPANSMSAELPSQYFGNTQNGSFKLRMPLQFILHAPKWANTYMCDNATHTLAALSMPATLSYKYNQMAIQS
eukprot:6200384-Pleurochrysis_carterae.AAC.3